MLTAGFRGRAWLYSAIVAGGLAVSACGSASSGSSSTTIATAGTSVASSEMRPSSSPAVTVERDVRFAAAPAADLWTDRVMDLYAAKDAHGAPLVVLFTAHGVTKDTWAEYAELATALAQRGIVVAVSNWSQLGTDESTADKVVDVVMQGRAVQACAVAFAVGRARRLGADPRRLVLMGQMYGGNLASLTALAPTVAPVRGCLDRTRRWQAAGLVVWDGDWLAGMNLWDSYGADAARIAAAVTPWNVLSTAPRVPVVAAFSDNTAQATQRCEAGTSPTWLAQRDPTGQMRQQLLLVDAFVDGCVDIGDGTTAMVAAMQAEGIEADVLELDGATTSEEVLDPADRTALVDATAALTGSD